MKENRYLVGITSASLSDLIAGSYALTTGSKWSTKNTFCVNRLTYYFIKDKLMFE